VKRKSGCASWLLAIAVLCAFALGLGAIGNRMDRARFPWGYKDSGRPALADTWVGTVVTGSGQRLGMLMDVELAPLDRGRQPPHADHSHTAKPLARGARDGVHDPGRPSAVRGEREAV
jgi:hypothetical protein